MDTNAITNNPFEAQHHLPFFTPASTQCGNTNAAAVSIPTYDYLPWHGFPTKSSEPSQLPNFIILLFCSLLLYHQCTPLR